MKLRAVWLAVAACTAISGAALSGTALGAEGNAERGKSLAYTCHGCHGVPNYKNSFPNYTVPKLGGQNAQYIIAALAAYASGERPHQTMHAQASTMSEQDRADIAAYLQNTGVQSKEAIGTPPTATQTCVACHGADGAKTVGPEYPILAGQYADYIEQALRDYKRGKRKNPIMVGIAGAVNEKDFAAIGEFFQQQRGLCSTEDLKQHGKCAPQGE
jgi:cytochrome c553